MQRTQAATRWVLSVLSVVIALSAALACAMRPAIAQADETRTDARDLAPGTIKPLSGELEPPSSENVSLYRVYNGFSGEHFYTISKDEKDHLVNIGWFTEGVGWKAPAKSNTPVYRLYNPNAGDHHYTTSADERDYLVKVGWNDEGIGWYSDDSKTIPVFRQYNPYAQTGTHNFTYSQEENDSLLKAGWRGEGTAWYASGPGESESMTWYSKTHLLALASCINSSESVTSGYATTIDGSRIDRLNQLVSTDVPVSFVAVNARTGKSVARGADWRFYGASTIKAPYVASLCKYDAPGIAGWYSTMAAVIQWSSNAGFDSLVANFGTFYEHSFANESGVSLEPYMSGTAYSYLTPRKLVKLWISIRDYIISLDVNADMFRSLFNHDYYKEGWMYDGDLGGQVYHVGGISGDVVYATMTRYQYGDSEVWAIKDAIVSSIS